MIDLSRAAVEREIMDTEACSQTELNEALGFLKITNRFFGGRRVILRNLQVFSKNWGRDEEIRILDVGCGLGDLDIAILNWAERRNFKVRITGLEMISQIAETAKDQTRGIPQIEILQADILNFTPVQPFDYVIASLFLHHIPPSQQVAALKKLDQIAVRGMILSDLERTWAGLLAVKALAYLAGNRIVRHDGPLSVRRAFRPEELRALARAAGLNYLKAEKECFFRLSLAGEKI
ncbi:MAG: hypothetical protein A2901_01480 [Elusimicrobia bacterium RIFCSPLOWO2_01_FULL_54_10]|nr:MAG: hypothetical protein A2901_01480 [Elusimicrobia bacterium RIFCSPLOWO2_01_FULL_54_10]